MNAAHGLDGPKPGARASALPGSANELSASQQQRMLQALIASLSGDGAAVRHVETHISHVLLHGGQAYKFKKVLATSFLDQSTLALRRAACDEELRLNRRLEPQIYLDVVPIAGTVDAPEMGGQGPPLDVALRMRAFDEDGLWDRLAARDTLLADDIDDLAAVVARFHGEADVATASSGFGTPALVRAAVLDSLRDLQNAGPAAAWPDAVDQLTLGSLQQWEAESFPRLDTSLARRLTEGRVREGHGDLHLGNVAREAWRSLVFDGIEFDPALRWIDVMSDVAFMAMDLHAHRLPAWAFRFVNAYLQHSGDYDGMHVFGYYLVHRALVRAKVAQLRAGQTAGLQRTEACEAAHRYLVLASRLSEPRRRVMLITHGLSGSGKTTLTQGLLELIGAVRVRADIERKRLAGLAPLQRSHSPLASGLYSAEMNEATHRRLLDAATAVLVGGWPVIVDASFLRRVDRDAARQRAAELGVPFAILHFDAPLETRRERVRHRAAQAQDASEADESVLDMQAQTQEPLQADEQGAVHTVRLSTLPGQPPRADWSTLLAQLRLPTDSTGP